MLVAWTASSPSRASSTSTLPAACTDEARGAGAPCSCRSSSAIRSALAAGRRELEAEGSGSSMMVAGPDAAAAAEGRLAARGSGAARGGGSARGGGAGDGEDAETAETVGAVTGDCAAGGTERPRRCRSEGTR